MEEMFMYDNFESYDSTFGEPNDTFLGSPLLGDGSETCGSVGL